MRARLFGGEGVKVARDLPLNAYCGRVRHHTNLKDMAGIGSQDYKVRTLVGGGKKGKNRSSHGGEGVGGSEDVYDVMMVWQVLTCNWKVRSCGEGHVPGWEVSMGLECHQKP